jgi:cytochrome P450
VRDPQAVFCELRATAPVHWLERHRAWLLLDHERVRIALNAEELSTDTITPLAERLDADARVRFEPARKLLMNWMIFNDPPVHTALRVPVREAFVPRAVSALSTAISQHVEQILDEHANGREQIDLVSALAFPLPATVIAILLGVPDDRQDEFRDMSRHLGALVMGKLSRADAWDRALKATHEFHELFGGLIERYREHPEDNLISRLAVAADDDACALSAEQLVGACSLLLFGGHETTTGLITNGVKAILRSPDERARLASDPPLIMSAVEELMRYDGPSKIVVRRARQDGEWAGVPLKAGETVFCALAAANRDPLVFDRPDDLDLTRSPNRHLGFGWGRHMCLGAQLARLEAQIAIPAFLGRFPTAQLAVEDEALQYQPTIVGRTIRALPIRL